MIWLWTPVHFCSVITLSLRTLTACFHKQTDFICVYIQCCHLHSMVSGALNFPFLFFFFILMTVAFILSSVAGHFPSIWVEWLWAIITHRQLWITIPLKVISTQKFCKSVLNNKIIGWNDHFETLNEFSPRSNIFSYLLLLQPLFFFPFIFLLIKKVKE